MCTYDLHPPHLPRVVRNSYKKAEAGREKVFPENVETRLVSAVHLTSSLGGTVSWQDLLSFTKIIEEEVPHLFPIRRKVLYSLTIAQHMSLSLTH